MATGEQMKVSGYFTHLLTLSKYAAKAPEGSTIIELGCGLYSTPVLSSIALARNLHYIVYSSDEIWMNKVKPCVHGNVNWNVVKDWKKWDMPEDAYMVFLDNEEYMVDRFKQIEKMLNKCAYVVIHDADTYTRRGLPLDKYYNVVEVDTSQTPHTAVVSASEAIVLRKNNEPYEDITNDDFVLEAAELLREKPVAKQPAKLNTQTIGNGGTITNVNRPPNNGVISNIPQKQNTTVISNVPEPLPDEGVVKAPVLKRPAKPFVEEEDIKTAVVCCYQAGGDYDAHWDDYVQRLADGVHKNTTDETDFYCVTIMNCDHLKGVKHIVPVDGTWKGWHIKAEIFREGMWDDYDRVLYIDLDTVITGNIDDIVKSKERVVMLRDFYQPNVRETGMLYFRPQDFEGLTVRFKAQNPSKAVKDAKIIENWIISNQLEPTFFQDLHKVGSYKVTWLRDSKNWRDYQIICFHGHPRPHEIGWNLDVQERVQKRRGPSAGRKKVRRPPVEVQPIWKDEDVFIIGGGPSLTNIDLDKFLMDYKVLGINDGYVFDCCDICYFGDTIWHKHHGEKLKEWGKPVYTTSGVMEKELQFLNTAPYGLSPHNTQLGWNCCSGWAGLNLALHFGASRIFLLGYDMSFGEEGESNWHKNIRKVNGNSYNVFLKNERKIFKDWKHFYSDVEIFNCIMPEKDSVLKIFPKVNFTELMGVSDNELYVKEQEVLEI